MTTSPLLRVDSLCIEFRARTGKVQAVRGISFTIHEGEFFCIVGESGSGKSVTAMALMGLLDANGVVTQGSINYAGQRLLDENTPRSKWIRPHDMSMIFQYPMVSLNPIRKVGLQLVDVLRVLHGNIGETACRGMASELLEQVRINEPERCMESYPFELSGGMCQRVLIAMALARKPRLLLADEPTTGLDVITQAAILKLLSDMVRERNMAVLLVTHDLGLAVRYSDRIGVMRYGHLLETGSPTELVRSPAVSYTRALFSSTPSLMRSLDDIRRLTKTTGDC